MSGRLEGAAGILEQVNGSPVLLGTITGNAAAQTNADTAVPFAIPFGARIILQSADSDIYWIPAQQVTADGQLGPGTNTASATTGMFLAQKAERQFCLRTVQNLVSCFGAGAYNVHVFLLT